MKKLLLLLIVCLSSLMIKAQVKYIDKMGGSYNMKINVITEKDSIFLDLVYTDEDLMITDTPKLLLKLSDDTIFSLDGILLSNQRISDGAIIASNLFVSEAKFPISRDQILQFKKGIKKLRLNTSPKYHEKEWRHDKIGVKLYETYIKSSSNSFEDGF